MEPSTGYCTLGATISRNLIHNMMVGVFLVAIGVAGVATQENVLTERPTVTTSTAALIAEHDCWTGEAPADMAGVVPGHVVVSVEGVARYAGERMVGKALAQTFDGTDHGLTVAAFCR